MATQTQWVGAAPPSEQQLGDMLRDCIRVTQRLQSTHDTLQREVVRLRRELEAKDRELERRRRLASLGELAAGVAHEVRNPLGAIQLYSGLLRNECGQAEAALHLIEKIEAGIRAIDGVVQDALALAPRSVTLKRCGVRALVARAQDVCLRTLQARGATLKVELEDERAAVLVEPAAIQRVLINLITNAAEASPRGAVVRVHVSSEREGLVEIRVLDEGAGLPEDVIERVFDPFFTTKAHGTGLGLTLAHRVVEAHGGRLTAGNRPEGGAVFSVMLPSGAAGEGERNNDAAAQTSAA